MAILPVWAPVCQSLQERAMRTFESDVGEDDFVVRFGIVFCGYPFEPWRDGVLSFHCSGTVLGAAVGLRISSCSYKSCAADFNALVLIRGDRGRQTWKVSRPISPGRNNSWSIFSVFVSHDAKYIYSATMKS